MLAGFGGHLIAEAFLEQQLAHALASPSSGSALALWRRSCQRMGPASSLRAMLEAACVPLLAALGHGHVSDAEYFADAAVATIRDLRPPAVVVVAPWGARLDPLWRRAVVEARRRGALWALLFNGSHLRLIEAQRLYSRRHVELDLDLALGDARAIAGLERIFHAHALDQGEGAAPLEILLEASGRHTSRVSQSLKDGVLAASGEVLSAIARRPTAELLDGIFDQALTLVYRLLFLLFAEARQLVPIWHPVYRESYSLEALRESAERGRSAGLWDAFRAISRLAHAGCHMGDLAVTPFNGRLFAPSRTPLAERRDLDDEAARRAIVALSSRPAIDRAAAERIVYRDLGVEQLGSVYETLLDFKPRIQPAPPGTRRGPAIALEPGSGTRKATGTFYTPQPIARYLVRRTLGPLVRGASPEQITALRVLDPAMGSGAFLVAACSFLAEAYESAMIDTGRCHASDIGSVERATFRRTIAERCLYGVDLNPMAVQLARLSLWLATLAADKPLSFLDHHLQTGDSLLGVWLSHLRRPPVAVGHRSNSLPLFGAAPAGEVLRAALPVRFALACTPNDTPEQVHQKERALAALGSPGSPMARWKTVADLWCAWWFGVRGDPKAFHALSDRVLHGGGALPQATADRMLQEATAAAAGRRFFHWELEFPEVFFDADGHRQPSPGFDAIIGNPPWDMVRADDNGSSVADRLAARAIVRFTRDSGVYAHQSDGHANRYQLFVERSVTLVRPGGRIGLVLPGGITADQGSARLRRLLFSECDVDAFVGFENRRRLFPIHRSVRFVLATATRGTPTSRIGCRLGETDAAVLDGEDDERFFPVHVTPALLQRLSGDNLAVPELRTSLDLTLAERAATLFPPLGHGDGWHAHFGRELNASDDRPSFRPPGSGLPVVEGKVLDPFRVNVTAVRHNVNARDAARLLGSRHLRPRLAYRDVASATNRMTLIAAVLPGRCVSTHTVFCLQSTFDLRRQHCLCGLFNSFVVNYLARLRVTTHVTTAIVEHLPVPGPSAMGGAFREIALLARILAKGTRLSATAALSALSRINALVARLYGLSDEEFAYVLGTFPLVNLEERDAALAEFRRL